MQRRIWVAVLLGALFGCSRSHPEGGGTPVPFPPDFPSCLPGACSTPNTCEPLTCATAFGQDRCGVLADGCGGQLDCGACSGEATCGGGGIAHVCAIPPQQAACTELRGRSSVEPVSGGILSLRECSGDGWCTSNSHMGTLIQDLWGFSEEDVWALGEQQGRGVALHWAGAGWKQVPVPSSEPLRGVWGAATHDVWAVGDGGTVLRWNGSEWRHFPSPTTENLTGVSGTSAEDVWLVGPHVALRWDGKALSETPGWTPAPEDPEDELSSGKTRLWAIRPDDVVAVGGPVCQRWNGETWAQTECGVRRATDVWASGPEDVWVVGTYSLGFHSYSERAHWDGLKWTTESFSDLRGSEFEPFLSLWGSGPRDIWLNGTWHFDGEQWSRMCRQTIQSVLWGPGSGRLFGHMSLRGLTRFDGQGWTLSAATRLGEPSFGKAQGGGTWGVSSNGSLFQFDGQGWGGRAIEGVSDYGLFHPFGSSADNVWTIAYGGALLRSTGQQWVDSGPLAAGMRIGWALSPTEAFVVGGDLHQRKMWRWEREEWSPVELNLGTDELLDMWGSAPDDVWAVGWRPPAGSSSCEGCENAIGVAWHWDGQKWERVYEQPGHTLKRITGTSRENVWAVDFRDGNTTTAWPLRWDGTNFRSTGQFNDTNYLEHLAGTGPDDMWMAAGLASSTHTRLYHFDGQRWREQEPLPGVVHSLGAVPGQSTFAATADGVLYERRR
jgi:hypothetical protein